MVQRKRQSLTKSVGMNARVNVKQSEFQKDQNKKEPGLKPNCYFTFA
jgi:hypothetical protein